MGYTRDEFVRLVPCVVGDNWQQHGDQLELQWGQGRVLIRLGADGYRRIANLQLPQISVSFSYEGLSAEERAAFDHRFDRSYQKGGG